MARLLDEDRVIFGADHTTSRAAKYFLDEVKTEGVPSILHDASSDDRRLAKLGVPFDHPSHSASPSGSCDGSHRIQAMWFSISSQGPVPQDTRCWPRTGAQRWPPFVLIQRAEQVGERSAGRRAGFETVIQMTRARLQRAIARMDEDALPGPSEDRGFRAERLIE